MYTPTSIKDKFSPPPSPKPYSAAIRRIVPRHAKSYIWLTFLMFIFGIMLLSDNGIPVTEFLPTFRTRSSLEQLPLADVDLELTPNVLLTSASTQHTTKSPAAATTPQASSNHGQPSRPQTNPTVHAPTFPVYGKGDNAFTPDDVLILFKTGATALWRRVPIHLSTSLSNKTLTPNIVFYSDQADSIADRSVVDVLANVSSTLRSKSSDFQLYRSLKTVRSYNHYLEGSSMEGEQWLPGGWRLDKYKFLPMMQHAATYHPGYKWYIYMEDDTYYFWHSLYTFLAANFSPSKEPLVVGGPAAKLGEDFAHGGSGFAISGAGLSKSFGADPHLASKYEDYAAEHCCGDQVLSHVLTSKGVPRYRGFDDSSWAGLQANPPFRLAFGKWNWCSPLFNMHKVHQSDVSRLWEFEKQFHTRRGYGDEAVLDWATLFKDYVGKDMLWEGESISGSESKSLSATESDQTEEDNDTTDDNARTGDHPSLSLLSRIPKKTLVLTEWDNYASERVLKSDITTDEHLTETERAAKPWFSAKSCEAACQEWSLCMTWRFQDDNCGLSSTVSSGMKVDDGVRVFSGYMGVRIREMVGQRECGRSQYVPAS